jgi:hypothetical protein
LEFLWRNLWATMVRRAVSPEWWRIVYSSCRNQVPVLSSVAELIGSK